LIPDPGEESIEIISVFTFNKKSFFSLSNWSSIESKVSNSPIDHPLNLSFETSSIVILNSLNPEVVGIPTVPPIETVSIWLFPYPNPVFTISKSITLEPWPTTISMIAFVPIPEEEDEE